MATIQIELFDEITVAGRRLGRAVEHDARSWAYDIEALLAPHVGVGPVEWPRYSPILEQTIGSCTGNAMAGWLGCAPHCTSPADAAKYDENYAVRLYGLATHLDGVPGAYPPTDTGSSGLAVAKAARRLGDIRGYSWAFTTLGLLRALQSGPVLAGSVWLSGMDEPDGDGFVSARGAVRGGHEFLIRGYWPDVDFGAGWLLCDNSWGPLWSPLGGSFRLRLADWERLRRMRADVTVPHT